MSNPYEITPQAAQSLLNDRKQATLIDVREPEEFAVAHIAGADLIPMGSVPGQLQKLEGLADSADLLILCHHGVRSLQVTHWLRAKGVENCYSVAGGIDRWSLEIDPNVPRY